MKRDRLEEIAELIDKRGKMSLEHLSQNFPDVSQMTLRRDLLTLEEDGRVIRVRGGAMSVKEVHKIAGEAYVKKTVINTDKKIEIAQKAATLIDEGISFFLDGGTTAMYLAKELPDFPCNIFTNGIAVAMELAQKKQPQITVIGGQLIKNNLSTAAPTARSYFDRSNFEVAIMSSSAFTLENGFTCSSQMEAELLRMAIQKAQHRYMMLDSSKIGKTMPFTFAMAEDIDVLITDDDFPKELKKAFADRNIVVI